MRRLPSHPLLSAGLYGVGALALAGCLDFKSETRKKSDADGTDASVSEDLADGDTEPADEPFDETEAAVDPVGSDADVSDGDPDGSAQDAGAVDEADSAVDAGEPGACPTEACPEAFPCVGTTQDFTCRGQFADTPLPRRTSGTSASAQQLRVERDQVIDEVTGLAWQRPRHNAVITFASAFTYCDELVLAKHDDWRLPSIHEFATLLGHDAAPDIDTTIFQGYGEAVYFTSTPDSVWLDNHWALRTGDLASFSQDLTFGAFVACVRTERVTYAGSPLDRFLFSENGALAHDTRTHLYWEAQVSIARSALRYESAEEYCAGLTLGGRTFRVPSLAELYSIVDYARPQGQRVPAGFSTRDEVFFWSRTRQSYMDDERYHGTLSNRGMAIQFDTTNTNELRGVRCVSDE